MANYYFDGISAQQTTLVENFTLRGVCCPIVEYDTQVTERSLQDELEDHLATYHYHQTALLELARSENSPNTSEWEYGAYLMGIKLQEHSEYLINKLSSKSGLKP